MKYKEEIQVIQFNSFLKQRDKIHTAITMRTKATNPSNQQYANYHEIEST